eukprot:3254181-Amphidinium_carterae.1
MHGGERTTVDQSVTSPFLAIVSVRERADAFGVPKNGPDELARHIIDRRPRNVVEKSYALVLQERAKRNLSAQVALALWRLTLLAHVRHLCDVICPRDTKLVTSCEDAKD